MPKPQENRINKQLDERKGMIFSRFYMMHCSLRITNSQYFGELFWQIRSID